MKRINLRVIKADQSIYKAVESYARRRYEEIHDAHIVCVSPIMLVAFLDEKIVGCLGISPAKAGPMLAESYIDGPITDFLEKLGLTDTHRDELVEVGSLAADNGCIAMLLLTQAPSHLQDGYSYAILTATRLIRRLIRCAGIVTQELAIARKQSLPVSRQRGWGRYYTDDPRVLLVDLSWTPALEARCAS